MSINTATIIGGPALVTYNGGTFYSKGDIKLTPEIRTFNVQSSRYGKMDERQDTVAIRVAFEPVGEWENLSVLYPYASTVVGSLIAPRSLAVTNLDLDTEILTTATHGFTTADAVLLHVSTGGTLPTSSPQVTQTTVYYVRAINTTTFTLHPTASDATNNTNPITFSVATVGTLYVDRDLPLVIHTFAGTKITVHNVGVSKMPGLSLSPAKTLLKEVEFSGFLRNGFARSTANSIYTPTAEALSDTSLDPANIKTVPFTAAWGATAPWSDIYTEDGWEIDFALKLSDVKDDTEGLRSMRFDSLEVSAKCTPIGITEAQLLDKMNIQGSGNIRGASLGGGDNLVITGPSSNPYVILYAARLKAAPQVFDSGKTRAGDLNFIATRSFTGGVANALFYVGTDAP